MLIIESIARKNYIRFWSLKYVLFREDVISMCTISMAECNSVSWQHTVIDFSICLRSFKFILIDSTILLMPVLLFPYIFTGNLLFPFAGSKLLPVLQHVALLAVFPFLALTKDAMLLICDLFF